MGWRGIFRCASGKWAIAALVMGASILLYLSIRSAFGASLAARAAQDRVFVCAATGKSFTHRLALSDSIPIRSPHSGRNTGYPAELCYWMADGKPRKEPTAVLLNSHIGKEGPTFCSDCGRLVVGHNPRPDGRRRPPPTRQQYMASLAGATAGRENPRRD